MAENITFPHREPSSYTAGSPTTHSHLDINKASSHAWNFSTFPLSQRLWFLRLSSCHSSTRMPHCTHRTYHESVPFWYLVCGQELILLSHLRFSIIKEIEGTQDDMREMSLWLCWFNTQAPPGNVSSLQQGILLRLYGHLRASLRNRCLMTPRADIPRIASSNLYPQPKLTVTFLSSFQLGNNMMLQT